MINEESWGTPDDGMVDAKMRLACSDHPKGHTLTLRAADVRRERGEVVCKFAIGVGSTTLFSDAATKLGREEERHRIANKLYGTRLTPGKLDCAVVEEYRQVHFEADLLIFSEQFYFRMMQTGDDGPTAGDSEFSIIPCHINGMVLVEGGTIIYAPPKAGKSYTALLMAVCIDAGINTLWGVNGAAPVLYINLERGKGSLTRRLGLVNRALGLPADRPLAMLNRRGRTLADVYDRVQWLVEQHGIKVIVLDSLTRGGFGNLNGNEEANRSMDLLNAACPSWIAIAHTPRTDTTHIFGSQMFDAAMDIGINIQRQRLPDGTLGVCFDVKDTNDVPVPPKRILAYEFNQFGLSHVREGRPGEFPEIDADAPRTPQMSIRDAIVTALQDDEDYDTDGLIDRVSDLLNGTVKRDSIRRTLEKRENARYWMGRSDGRWALVAIPTAPEGVF